MYHSIIFNESGIISSNGVNTYDDWFLIPASRPVISPPPPQANMVSIPGTDGTRDLSELATGRPLFGDRSGSIQFYLEPGHWSWDEAYSTIANYLHGQRLNAILEDDPYFYYDGRFSVSQWQSDASWETITINYVCSPYKQRIYYAGGDWLWDELKFVADNIIEDYENRAISSLSNGVQIRGYGMPTVPWIYVTNPGVTLRLGTNTVYLNRAGEHTVYNNADLVKLTHTNGPATLYVSGPGRITIRYRGGSL